jgi:TldD protein
MKVENSKFLEKKKNIAKKLVLELRKSYKYVSILGTDCVGKQYSVSKKTTSISDTLWKERGFVVRVFNGFNYTEHSFNEFNEENFSEVITKIKKEVGYSLELKSKNIQLSEYPLIIEEKIEKQFFSEVQLNPENFPIEEVLKKLKDLTNSFYKFSPHIIDSKAVFEWVKVSKFFISENKELEQSYMWSQLYVIPIVLKDGNTKYIYKAFSGLKGIEILNEVKEEYMKKEILKLEKLLSAKRIKPGEYDVICSPEIAGLIAHEAFGHGVEMDMFVKNRAKAQEYMNNRVASELVQMHDGAKSAQHVSSYFFDDEGVLSKDTIIIEKGILKKGINDILSAIKLNVEPTGNGKRESFENKVYSRMTNTFFSPGKDKLEDMISKIDSGFMLTDELSGMEDPKNWGIQCLLLTAIEIKDGKLTENYYSPVIVTGYVPDVLKNIDMISDEFELFGSGACGKGYKEYVKVSCGGPFIKTKVRLG